MARVLFYTGISLLVISAILLYLPACFSFFLVAFLLLALVLCVVFRKRILKTGIIVLISISLLFSVFGAFLIKTRVSPAENLSDYKAEIVGTVKDWPLRYSDYSVYEIKTESIKIIYKKGQARFKNVPQNIKLRMSDVNNIDADIFEKVKLEVLFNPLEDYKNSSFANGVYAGGYVIKLIERKGENRPFYACFYDLREYVNRLIYDNINYDEATVVSAILLGDRSNLSDEFYYNSKVAGVTHVLVVSGMHLGIIFQFLMILFSLLRFSKRLTSIFLIGFIFAISAVCGFTPSILRAGLTYLIMALGYIIYRRPDPLNSLGAATIIILFTNPFGFGNISLLLSLLSTFGILYICPILYLKSQIIIEGLGLSYKPVKALVFSICQTISATITTAPISILCFGYISVVAPITNVLIGYAVSVLLVLSLVAVIALCFTGVFKSVAALPVVAICLSVRYIVWAINYCASIPWSVFITKPIFLIPWLLLFITICFLAGKGIIKHQKIKKIFNIVLVVILSVSIILFSVCYGGFKENAVSVLNVGNGSCIVFNIDGVSVAVGAGDTKDDALKIKNKMLSIGVTKLDYLILPSLQKSVSGGAVNLIAYLRPTKVILSSSGEYKDKLEHINNDSFNWFDKKAYLEPTKTSEVFVVSNVGVVVNSTEFSYVIALGDLVKDLYPLATNKNPILILVDKISGDVSKFDFSKIILSNKKISFKNTDVPVLEMNNKDLREVY